VQIGAQVTCKLHSHEQCTACCALVTHLGYVLMHSAVYLVLTGLTKMRGHDPDHRIQVQCRVSFSTWTEYWLTSILYFFLYTLPFTCPWSVWSDLLFLCSFWRLPNEYVDRYVSVHVVWSTEEEANKDVWRDKWYIWLKRVLVYDAFCHVFTETCTKDIRSVDWLLPIHAA
jgi:hypothetical protein